MSEADMDNGFKFNVILGFAHIDFIPRAHAFDL